MVVTIPEHLREAIGEMAGFRLQAAADGVWSEERRDAVVEAALVWRAFATDSLTPSQTAMLAREAAAWLEPIWPEGTKDVDKVYPLLETTRELLQLRDRAMAASRRDRRSECPAPGRRAK